MGAKAAHSHRYEEIVPFNESDPNVDKSLHNITLSEVRNHDPKEHTHVEADITDLEHDAQKIKGKEVDDSAIGDNKVLVYKASSGKIEYASAGAGTGDMLKSVYDTNDNDKVDVAENAELLDGSTKTQVQDHPPKEHGNEVHYESYITGSQVPTNEVDPSIHSTLKGITLTEVRDHEPKAHTLSSHSTRAHGELTDVTADQHHPRSHDHSLSVDGSPIAVAGVPNLPATKITSGTFELGRIPRIDLTRMPLGASGHFIKGQGTSDPVYAALTPDDVPSLDASKITSGTFNVSRGGTGLNSLAAGGILYISSTNTLSRIAPTAANQVLRSTGENALTIGPLVSADIPWTSIGAVLTPDVHGTRDIGTSNARFRDIYLQGQMNATRALLFGETSDPSVTDGLFWHRTDLGKLRSRTRGLVGDLPLASRIITSVSTISATTTETAFANFTMNIPANYLQAGKTIRIRLWGTHTSSSSPVNPRFRFRFGGTTGTILLDTGTITAVASQTNCLIAIEAIITAVTTTSVECQGIVQFNPATANTPPLRTYVMNSAGTVGTTGNSAPVTISTGASDLVLTCVFSGTTTGNSVSIRTGIVEVI